MCQYLFLFVLCQNVKNYCTALSAVFDWICSLKDVIIIIIIPVNVYHVRMDFLTGFTL